MDKPPFTVPNDLPVHKPSATAAMVAETFAQALDDLMRKGMNPADLTDAVVILLATCIRTYAKRPRATIIAICNVMLAQADLFEEDSSDPVKTQRMPSSPNIDLN